MQNAEYWIARALKRKLANEKRAMRTVSEIEKLYAQALAQIQKDIAYWLARFAENNEIDMTEARKLLKADELEEFKWTLEEYIKNGSDENLSKEWMKELENASAKVHISRLEAIRLQIQQELEKVTGKEVNALESLLKETYEDEYYHRIFDVQQGMGFGSTFAKLSERQIEAAVNHPWASDGSSFSDRIWKNKKTLLNTLDQEVTRTILTGKPWSEATEAIAKKLNVEKSKAGRLVMTESAAIATEAEKACYKELDVDEYKIIATLDKRTSQICREMDGKHFPVSEMKAGVTAPPFHPWCRTDTAPYFDDWEEMGISPERAARDQADQVYYVPESMTYREWESKQTLYMSNSFRTKINKDHPVKIGTSEKELYPVTNSKFDLMSDTTNTRDKAIRLAEKLLTEIQNKLPEGFKIPSVAVVDFEKYGFEVDAIGGYNEETRVVFLNSKYNTRKAILEWVQKKKGRFANTTEYAPILHELGHKSYEDSIEKLANTKEIAYNDAKKAIDKKIMDFVDNGYKYTFAKDVSGYANEGYLSGNVTEIYAECFSSRNTNQTAKQIVDLVDKEVEEYDVATIKRSEETGGEIGKSSDE